MDNVTTIRVGQRPVTFINTFMVKPENQDRFAALQAEDMQRLGPTMPGFVSANIHKSYDGTRVANYAQWDSEDALNAWRLTPEFKEHIAQIRDLIEGNEGFVFEIVATSHA